MEYIFEFVRKEGDVAILKDENGDEVVWSAGKLPDLDVGEKIYFHISKDSFKDRSSKDILNEILKD